MFVPHFHSDAASQFLLKLTPYFLQRFLMEGGNKLVSRGS